MDLPAVKPRHIVPQKKKHILNATKVRNKMKIKKKIYCYTFNFWYIFVKKNSKITTWVAEGKD